MSEIENFEQINSIYLIFFNEITIFFIFSLFSLSKHRLLTQAELEFITAHLSYEYCCLSEFGGDEDVEVNQSK